MVFPQPRGWKDKLTLRENQGYWGVRWLVWDDLEGGAMEGATIGECGPDPEDPEDQEFTAVHESVKAFWSTNQARADWVPGGFWFENETNARKALTHANKALATCRKSAIKEL